MKRSRFSEKQIIGVTRELDLLIAVHGKPKAIGTDNGTELTSNAILNWTTGATSIRASRCRTPFSRTSTAGCAMSS